MTDTIAADHRRATALVVHYGYQDQAGIDAILSEALQARRIAPLLAAVLDLHAGIIPTLHTELGLLCVNDMLGSIITAPDSDPDTVLAVQIITSRAARTAWPAALQDAPADRVAELLLRVVATLKAVVPGLHSPLALQALRRGVVDWAARDTDD